MFRKKIANLHAVEDVSFTINRGQTFSLVGESGVGKPLSLDLFLDLRIGVWRGLYGWS